MSHELRTPLNAVIGFSEAFAADPDPARGAEYVRSIHEAGRELLALIDNILDVARAETLGFQTHDGEIDMAELAADRVRTKSAEAAASGAGPSLAPAPPL